MNVGGWRYSDDLLDRMKKAEEQRLIESLREPDNYVSQIVKDYEEYVIHKAEELFGNDFKEGKMKIVCEITGCDFNEDGTAVIHTKLTPAPEEKSKKGGKEE